MKPILLDTTIPFSGFYESMHSSELDRAIEQIAQDDSGDTVPLFDEDGEEFPLWDHVTWNKIQTDYAKFYVENFAAYFEGETGIDLGLKFDEVSSPREYNFTTDRIFAKIRQSAVLAMFKKVDKTVLDALIRERFTSYDGFSSYYANSLAEWPQSVKEWDHNQIGTLIEAVLGEFDEYSLIEDIDSNGNLSNIVFEALDADAVRIVNAYDKERQAKEYFRSHQMTLPTGGAA